MKKSSKKKKLYFLYKFGYDYASTHVHPMANDGMVEYFRMVKNPPPTVVSNFNYQTLTIMKNSALISSLTANSCLNFSSFKWRTLVFNFIESFRQAMNDQPNEFELNFHRMKIFVDNNEPLGERIEKEKH